MHEVPCFLGYCASPVCPSSSSLAVRTGSHNIGHATKLSSLYSSCARYEAFFLAQSSHEIRHSQAKQQRAQQLADLQAPCEPSGCSTGWMPSGSCWQDADRDMHCLASSALCNDTDSQLFSVESAAVPVPWRSTATVRQAGPHSAQCLHSKMG